MLFLQGHGVSTGLAVKIYKQYGDAAIDLVQADPYRLAQDIYGIGFKTADKIAHDLGLPHDAPSRVAAGVVYTLSNFTDQGHVFAPQSQLIHDASELLEVQPDQVTASLDTLIQTDQIKRESSIRSRDRCQNDSCRNPNHPARNFRPPIKQRTPRRSLTRSANSNRCRRSVLSQQALRDEPAIYLTPFYQGEVSVAKRLNAIIDSKLSRLSDLQHIDLQAALNELSSVVSNRPTARLSDQQQQAVRAALKNKVTVLDRRPGHRQDHDHARRDRSAGEIQSPLRAGLAHGPRRQAPEPGHRSTGQDHPSVVGVRAAAKASSATRRIRWRSICSSSTKPA